MRRKKSEWSLNADCAAGQVRKRHCVRFSGSAPRDQVTRAVADHFEVAAQGGAEFSVNVGLGKYQLVLSSVDVCFPLKADVVHE
jgi:hypothetical protein